MRKSASIILGSGFSYSAGIPLVPQLNKSLSKIHESEITIHSSMRAWFLNGKTELNRFQRRDERLLFQEFLEFYNERVLKSNEQFDYETFYDYYSLYLHNRQNSEQIEAFYKEFGDRHIQGKDRTNCYNRLSAFNRTFNQLLASLLDVNDYRTDIGISGGILGYGGFVGCLRELMKTHDVKVHTLNHDIFFEWLAGNSSDLFEHFTDGYHPVAGSHFYGRLSYPVKSETFPGTHRTYYVKLKHFDGVYNKPLCLYKLHGSIDSIIVYETNQVMRIKQEYGVYDFLKEVRDEATGIFRFESLHDQVDPDFLTGTTNKMRFYSDDPHYEKLFNHFKTNLANSEFIIVIGYGFKDPGINNFLEEDFLKSGKKMLVIDPNESLSEHELITKYNVEHLPMGVDIPYEVYMQLLNGLTQLSK